MPVVLIIKSRTTFYQGNPAIFIRPVAFRLPITRGLAFYRKFICKYHAQEDEGTYILNIQVVERDTLLSDLCNYDI
jgi:hypothetical protein